MFIYIIMIKTCQISPKRKFSCHYTTDWLIVQDSYVSSLFQHVELLLYFQVFRVVSSPLTVLPDL